MGNEPSVDWHAWDAWMQWLEWVRYKHELEREELENNMGSGI